MKLNLFDVTKSRVAISGMPMDTGADTMFSKVSASLGKAANESLAEWQDAVVKQEAAAGEMEGAGGDPQYKAGNNLAAEAYNAAAKKSYVTNLETKAASAMGQFAEKYKNDPVGYQKATTDYMNGLTQELKSKSQTAGMADLFAGRLALDAQKQQYSIQKRQAEIQKEQMQADNEDLYMTIKNNAYREAGGVFSKDPNVQRNTLMQFQLSKQALDSSLHAVLPDGTPVYSPKEVQNREEDFFRSYYTQAAKNYVTQGNPSPEDLSKLMDGTMEIDVPGLGKINLLDNIGADRYDKDVVNFTISKIKEQEAMQKKAEALSEKASNEYRENRGLELMAGMLTGQAVTVDQIMDDARTGKLKATDAKALIKIATDANTGVDDPEVVAALKVRAALGEDVTSEVKRQANRMSGKTFQELLDTTAKAQRGVINDNKALLIKQVIKKDAFGFDDPNSLAKANDVGTAYENMIKDGMEPILAYEKSQMLVDQVKGEESGFKRVPRYAVVNLDTKALDIQETIKKTREYYNNKMISEEEYMIELERLTTLNQEAKNAATNR